MNDGRTWKIRHGTYSDHGWGSASSAQTITSYTMEDFDGIS